MVKSELTSSLPKHTEIAQYLRDAIRRGELKVGSLLASENELCRRFSSSRTPVRRALEELESERLIRRERGIGTFVAQPMEVIGSGFKRLRVVFDSAQIRPNHFVVNEMLQMAEYEKSSGDGGFRLNMEFHEFTGVNDTVAEGILNDRGFDGLLIVGFRQPCVDFLNQVQRTAIPTMTFFARLDNRNLGSVWIDQEIGAYRATEHLLRLGHRNVGLVLPAFVDGPDEKMRERGFRRALEAAGIFEPQVVRIGVESFAASASLRSLLKSKKRPSALLVAGGMLHRSVADSIRFEKLQVPEDISVICIDDSETARLMEKQWSVVRQPVGEGVKQALDHLMSLIYHPEDSVFCKAIKPELILRDSCQPLVPLPRYDRG